MVRLTPEQFEGLVARAIETLPTEYSSLVENVYVVIEESPSADDLKDLGMRPDEADELLGLYQGTPQGERGMEYSELPDRVVIYRRSILSCCDTEEEVYEEVRDTLVHELGHYFGLDDEEMPY